MPYDPLQLQTDVDFITSQPQWQDEKTRREYIRQVGVQAKGNLDNEAHTELMNTLWGKMDTRGKLQKAGAFVGTAVGEVVKSIPATFGAVGTALGDIAGVTDTGSGARLKAGVSGLVDTAGQRIKQLDPNDRQEQRDALIESLREDIDKGAVPQGFEKWLAGEYDNKEIDDPETKAFVDAVVSGISRAGTAADKMGDIDYDSLRGFMESDRNPARADSDIPGEMGARQLLADYAATRDPQSWQQFKERVTETEAQYKNRLSKYAAQKPQVEEALARMPEGIEKEMVQRSLSMQESPIDLASALVPAVRGAKALQAAKAGGFGAAAGRFAKGAAIEGAQEAGTEALQDPRATAAQIAEAGALGAVGAGALEAGAAGIGAASRRIGGAPAAAPTTPETPAPVAPSAAESVTVESGEMPLPTVLKNLDEKVKAAVEANADVLPATAAALKETAPELVVEETVVAEAPAAPAAPVVEEAVVTETPAQEESPAAPPAEPTDATEGQTPTPGGVGAPPVVTNEPQTPSPAKQPVSAAQTPVATEPEASAPSAKTEEERHQDAWRLQNMEFALERDLNEIGHYEKILQRRNLTSSEQEGYEMLKKRANTLRQEIRKAKEAAAAQTPVATEPEAPLPETEKVVAPKAEPEQGAGMTQRDTSKPEEMSPEEKAALYITKLKGVEYKGDGIVFVPEKMMTPKRRKEIKRGGNLIEVKAWADVTGNPSDRGYAIIDRRARRAFRNNLPVDVSAVDAHKIKLPEGYVRQGDLYVFAPEAPAAPAPKVEPEQGEGVTQQKFKDRRDSVPVEDRADYDEFMSLIERRGQAKNKVKGVTFSKAEEKRFQELGKKLRKYLFETVDPSTDPVIWKDINGQDIHLSAKGTLYTLENGRVRTGPAFESEDFIKGFVPKPVPADFIEKADAADLLPEGYVRQGDLYVFAPEAPPTQTETQPKPEDASKNQVEETGGTPPVESQPPQTRPEGEAQEGASQRGREGEEGVLTPEKAAPGVEPGAALTKKKKILPDAATLTNSQINKERDKLRKQRDEITEKMIAAGRGNETPDQTFKKTDKLSVAFQENASRLQELAFEAEVRMGGKVYGALPTDKTWKTYRRKKPEDVVTPSESEFGSTNTIFTKEKAEEASKIIKRKLGQTNVPAFDPELFAAATNYAGFLIEGGVRKFGDFSSRMISEFGETVRPILKSVYSGIRELDIIEGMDDAATVSKVLAGETPAAAPAPAPVKAQPKAPTEPAETPEQVGIANAAVDVAREAIGLPPIERPVQEVYGDDQVWSDAESAMTAEPDRARYLVKSLIESPRQASTLETAILLRETVARTARLQQASIELVNATPENKESARQKYDDAVMALTEVQEASALAGAEQGRAFRARRFLADLNYNLAAMTTTLQGAHQRKLTDAEVAEVMAQSEKINKALKEVNDLKDSAGAVAEEESIFAEVVKEAKAEARLNAKEAISTAKSEIKSGRSVMDVINEKRDAARARLRKRGGSLNVGLNPADLVDYAIIAASYIAEGAVTLKDVTVKMVKEFGAAIEQHMPKIFSEAQVLKSELDNVAVEEPSEAAEKPKGKKPAIEQLREDGEISGRLVYEMVKEKVKSGLTTLDEVFKAVTADVQTVVPEITERELRDLFSGYGKVKFPSQEELPKKVRELRRLAQLASAIEDAQNKIAPLRSGPQRDEASLAVREAQKELHRIMKEQGIQRAPGPRALKSALDAAKTRLRNQIEELEKQVKERKRVPADKRDIVYDQETKDLIAKRDELQATLEEIDPPQPPTAQELIKKALKELDKAIAELEKKVKERDISKPATTETPITEQIQIKRDQRDALRRQLKDIRIEIEGEPYLTQEQVNERAERNLTRQIDELQRQIDEKDFEQSQGQKPENTAAIIRLKARRDTLREQRDILREQTLGKKVKSEAERIDIAVKALEKSIDSLNERIRKGEVMPKAREDKTPQVAKVRNLRAERDSLRSVLTQMRKAQEEAAKDPEVEQLRRDRQYLESQIKNYQKKLASGDFRPQPKKAKEYSNKLADKTLELQKLKEEWAEKVFIAQLNSRGKAAKAYDFVKQVLHTSRSVLTSFDVSAVFRQGGFIALGNPIRAFRNLKPMFESLASERAAQRTKDELESRPNFKLYQQSKLYLADFNQLAMNQQEEAFMSRWLNKIPKALGGGIIRGSQRAYVTFLNRLRADTFDAMLGSLQKGPEPTTEEIKAIADYINIATGRGDLGKFQQAGEALNTVFFAPRLVASRFQILGGYPYFKASGRTKNLVLREYAKFLTGAALVYALGIAFQDEEDKAVEIDPRSSDFLKLRYGDTRVDPLGGLIQATVFLSRVVSGEKKQLSGKVVPIRDSYRLMNLFRESPRKDKVRYGADNTFDVGANFLRSKFSPSFGAAVDILTGETVVGEKTTPTEVGYKMVMPITFGEAKETLEAHGMPAGPALTIISLFGMGVQTYD